MDDETMNGYERGALYWEAKYGQAIQDRRQRRLALLHSVAAWLRKQPLRRHPERMAEEMLETFEAK